LWARATGQGDEDVLRVEGIASLRRRRIVRLTEEARQQGVLLGYEDLAGLLLVSMATLKRDVSYIENGGYTVFLRGRRKNGIAESPGAR
jgi:DeoR/GlpR family transcriptional regulator of sugar metabolism